MGAAPGKGSPTELCLCLPALFSSSAFSLQLAGLASSSPHSPLLSIYIPQHLNFPSEIQKEPVVWKDTLGKLGSSKIPVHFFSAACPAVCNNLPMPHSLFITFIPCCHPVQPNFLLSHHLNAFPPPFYVNCGLDFVRVTEMQLYCTVSLQHSETH